MSPTRLPCSIIPLQISSSHMHSEQAFSWDCSDGSLLNHNLPLRGHGFCHITTPYTNSVSLAQISQPYSNIL